MEMPLNALEKGMELIRLVRAGLHEVRCPTLLIYGDADQIVDKSNGPYVLEHVGASDKRLLALADSSHEVTLDYDRERLMVEAYDFIRQVSSKVEVVETSSTGS